MISKMIKDLNEDIDYKKERIREFKEQKEENKDKAGVLELLNDWIRIKENEIRKLENRRFYYLYGRS